MFTLPKSERLHGKTQVELLFEKGEKWSCYPFRLVMNFVEDESDAAPLRMLVSVSKRSFKRAVDRNKLKRRIREAYRINKFKLLDVVSAHSSEKGNKKLILGFLYTSKQIESYALIEKKLLKALEEISDRIKINVSQRK